MIFSELQVQCRSVFVEYFIKMVLYSEKSKVRLVGKTVVITGCNTGIGKGTARDLYKRGARVIMACRNLEKAEEAAKDIVESCTGLQDTGKVVIIELNLSSLQSVRECCHKLLEKEEEINLLINNAGIMACPYSKTEDGFETQFATNHLGHFLLTMLLLPKLIKSAPARIVTVSSALHRGNIDFDDINWEKRSYSPMLAYQQSKLANILFMQELDRRLKAANIEGVTVYSLHPGAIDTDLQRHWDESYFKGVQWVYRNLGKLFIKTPIEGSQTTIYCAIDEKAGKESGLYYADAKATRPCISSTTKQSAAQLWDRSLEYVDLKGHDAFKQ